MLLQHLPDLLPLLLLEALLHLLVPVYLDVHEVLLVQEDQL
jgi:hypothetical protein